MTAYELTTLLANVPANAPVFVTVGDSEKVYSMTNLATGQVEDIRLLVTL